MYSKSKAFLNEKNRTSNKRYLRNSDTTKLTYDVGFISF